MKHNINKVVFLDFETYYSTEFSLTKQLYNTSSYIRDEQFKVHCVAIKIGEGETVCYNEQDSVNALTSIDWEEYALCAHNTSFDGFILSELYGIVPYYYYDTVSMTRGLHHEVSRANLDSIAKFYRIGDKSKTYLAPTKGLRDLDKRVMQDLMDGCILDVKLCYEVFKKQLEVYPLHELDLIDLTIRMFCDPVLVINEKTARQALADEMLLRLATILKSGASEENLRSDIKFAKLLTNAGVTPPIKISNKTGSEAFAFAQSDQEFIDLLNHDNEQVVLLAQARLAAKSTQAETRAARLLQAGEHGHKLPVGYTYFGAKTGRWSGNNKLNLQNLPRVNPNEPKPSDGLRKSIYAPQGHSLVVTDSAQIEARIAAWASGQKDIVQLFAEDKDVYKHMASTIYHKDAINITKDERFIGKIAVLGLGYGMGPAKFKTTLSLGTMGPAVDITLRQAERIVELYRQRNLFIVAAWKELDRMLYHMVRKGSGFVLNNLLEYDSMTVWLPNGLGLHYPELHKDPVLGLQYKANNTWKKIYGGLMFENVVQALARVVIGEQILATQDYLRTLKLKKNEVARVVMTTHDEIVTVVPTELASTVLDKQIFIMCIPPHNWGGDIPFNAEGGYAENYSK